MVIRRAQLESCLLTKWSENKASYSFGTLSTSSPFHEAVSKEVTIAKSPTLEFSFTPQLWNLYVFVQPIFTLTLCWMMNDPVTPTPVHQAPPVTRAPHSAVSIPTGVDCFWRARQVSFCWGFHCTCRIIRGSLTPTNSPTWSRNPKLKTHFLGSLLNAPLEMAQHSYQPLTP